MQKALLWVKSIKTLLKQFMSLCKQLLIGNNKNTFPIPLTVFQIPNNLQCWFRPFLQDNFFPRIYAHCSLVVWCTIMSAGMYAHIYTLFFPSSRDMAEKVHQQCYTSSTIYSLILSFQFAIITNLVILMWSTFVLHSMKEILAYKTCHWFELLPPSPKCSAVFWRKID